MKTTAKNRARKRPARRRSIGTASFHVWPNVVQVFLPGDDVAPSFTVPASSTANFESAIQHQMRLHRRLGYKVTRRDYNPQGQLVSEPGS